MKKILSKKKFFYIIIIAMVAISLISISAVCNRCGATGSPDDDSGKIDIDRTGRESVESGAATTEKDDSEDKGDADEEKNSPTVSLKVYEGPLYSAPDDVCYYRVEATVTGNPAPDIVWSKDDSNNAFGDFKAQVNLTRTSPNYTLRATVTNSEGTDFDEIPLSWGCNGENKNPVVTAINLSESNIFINEVYAATAVASDPDGDAITYKWTATGGMILNSTTNPVQWTSPGVSGSYTITVTVKDNKGGEASKDLNVLVNVPLPPAVAAQDLPIVFSEGGYIEENGFVNAGGCMYAGDSGAPGGQFAGNKGVRGFISFDISHLSGVTITDLEFHAVAKQKFGDPSDLGTFYIDNVKWSARPLISDDFNIPGTVNGTIGSIGNGNFSGGVLKQSLQNAIDSGDQRFQLRFRFHTKTDNDNTWDGIEYDQAGIRLFIVYEM